MLIKRIPTRKGFAKYAHEDSYKKRSSKPRRIYQLYATIKTPRPSQIKVRIIHPSFSTLELWKVLTWPSEGIWPTPHRCSLLGLLFLLCRYCFECVRTVWLTGDFLASSIGAVCGNCNLQTIPSLLGQRVAWYLLDRWQPPTTFRDTNHAQPPSRDRFKLSPLPWNTSPSKTMIWKSNCVKRTQGITHKKKTKKVPTPRERTKRGQKVAIPQVDQNNRTWAAYSSQTQLRHI